MTSPKTVRLTARQSLAVDLRMLKGAKTSQVAKWLGISERAVRYRLQLARERALRAGIRLEDKNQPTKM